MVEIMGAVEDIMAKDSHPVDFVSNYEFPNMVSNWLTYDSTSDPTNLASNIWVRGSLNMYKTLSGTIANRPGQKRLGVANGAYTPINSKFVWNTTFNQTYAMVVSGGILYAFYNDIFYPLLQNLTTSRFVFDEWWDAPNQQGLLLFVNGTSNIYSWTGGFGILGSASNASGVISVLNAAPTVPGSGYTVGDILTIMTGGTGGTATVLTLTNQNINSVTVDPLDSGGLGYVVNDVLVIPGVIPNLGSGVPCTVLVTSVSGGSVTGVTIQTEGGQYPGNATQIRAQGGSGIGCFLEYTVTNSGVGTVAIKTNGSGYTTGTGKVTTGGTGTGATLNITTVATGALTLANTAMTWGELGFSPTGTVNINSNQYTYTSGIGTNTLTGINSNPSIEPAGSAVIQSVITTANTPASAPFIGEFIKVINNQSYVGSYSSRLIYVSSATDYTNYTIVLPRAVGSPDLITLSQNAKGIGLRKGNAYIGFGTSSWLIVEYTQTTIGADAATATIVSSANNTVTPAAILQGPYAHEFIATVGDSLVYLSQDQQLRSYTDANDLFTPAYPSFSQSIATELSQENFNGGSLTNIGEFTYLSSAVSGKTYLYQVRTSVDPEGRMIAERIWDAPFQWNAMGIDQIGGMVVSFSNANPQIYQVWNTNQWHDDSPSGQPLPYNSVLALSYRGGIERRQGLFAFDKNFTEVYATPNTTLLCDINYNYDGTTNVITATITKPTQLGYSFAPQDPSLGDSSLGDEPLGDAVDLDPNAQNLIPKYKVINSLSPSNSFEYQPIYYSQNVDDRWELLACATNEVVANEQNATFIINKKQT